MTDLQIKTVVQVSSERQKRIGNVSEVVSCLSKVLVCCPKTLLKKEFTENDF